MGHRETVQPKLFEGSAWVHAERKDVTVLLFHINNCTMTNNMIVSAVGIRNSVCMCLHLGIGWGVREERKSSKKRAFFTS